MLETMFGNVKETFYLCSFNQSISSMLENLTRKQFIAMLKLLGFIFHDGYRAHFA